MFNSVVGAAVASTPYIMTNRMFAIEDRTPMVQGLSAKIDPNWRAGTNLARPRASLVITHT